VCALTTALIIGSVGLAAPSATADPTRTGVASLQTNAATDPLGIPLTTPQLSWRLTSSARGTMQSAYQLRVATSEQQLEHPDVWDSGRTVSASSVGVAYGGPVLDPTTRYVWQVRVWDQAGVASDWSAPATFETALGGLG